MKAAAVQPSRRLASALAGGIAAAALAWGAWYGLGLVLAQPVRQVAFAGDVDRLAPAELEALSRTVRAAPSASLHEIRAAARRVPWVREATVRRVFPDAVEVTFSAFTAYARWNDAELVTEAGEVFTAPDAGALPRLRGPAGSAPLVVREYALAAAALAPLGEPVSELRLSPRGAWSATLASGMAMALGRGDWRPRAERFVRAWPRLGQEARAATYADLRYPGGFALRQAGGPAPLPAQARGRNP